MEKDVFAQLVESYTKGGGLVLVVGAGLSAGSGLPCWPDVLRRLSGRFLGSDGAAIFDRLVREGYAFPTIASILEARSGTREAFTDALREELYRGFEYYGPGVTDQNRADFIKAVQQNSTLRAVASLCVLRNETTGTYGPNPRIHAVVNFNFDALLQTLVRERYRLGILRTVDRPSARAIPGRIPVYHMHGFLRFEERYFRDRTKEAPDLRVFTEQEYFDFYSQPFSVYNYTFLHLLREFPCLFIGMSLKDDNVRRLLHYSRAERVSSDLREGLDLEAAESNSARHFALLRTFDPPAVDRVRLDPAVELSQGRLGVNVVWFDAFDDIPQRLKDLYTSGGDNWQAVH